MALNFELHIDDDTGVVDKGATLIISDITDNYGAPEVERNEVAVYVLPFFLQNEEPIQTSDPVEIGSDPLSATTWTFKPSFTGVYKIKCFAVKVISGAGDLSEGISEVGRIYYVSGTGLQRVSAYSDPTYTLVSASQSELPDYSGYEATFTFNELVPYQYVFQLDRQGYLYKTYDSPKHERGRELFLDMLAALSGAQNDLSGANETGAVDNMKLFGRYVEQSIKRGY